MLSRKVVFSLLMVASAVSVARAESARDYFTALLAEVNVVLMDPDLAPAERRERMVGIYADNVDFDAIAGEALGRHAGRFDDGQRAEFDRLLRASLLDFWGRETLRFRGGPVELDAFGKFALSGNAYAITVGRYRSGFGPANRDRERTRSKFLMARGDDGWRIVRVQVGGVEVAANFRRQIEQVFAEGKSVDDLLAVMRATGGGAAEGR